MNYRARNITACLLLSLLIACLLPVMYLGRYNHPTGDDYYYAANTKKVWEQTGSLPMTIAEAGRGVAEQYVKWQGTYSAMLLMHLPPNIFGDTAYRATTSILLLLLTGSIFYLLKPLVCNMLKGSTALWIILSSLLALLCVQTVPSQGESFFWYNGSMYYTGFYAATLFLFGIVCRYVTDAKRRHIPGMLGLACFVAGGNYVSLLPALLLLICLTTLLICRKKKTALWVVCTALTAAIGLLISAMAPGNAVRQSDMWKIPAWKAVLKSLRQGIHYTTAWIGPWLILALLIMTPFLWRACSEISFRFRYPLLVAAFVYGIFCSMSCPTFYTMNSTGPARAVAIVYYGFLLAVLICYIYFIGWLQRAASEKYHVDKKAVSFLKYCGGIVCILILAAQLFGGKLSETTTGKAAQLLLSREAAKYEQEYQERLITLNDAAIENVVFQPYEHQPDMLYVGDFSGNAQEPGAKIIAGYFGKDSICVAY